MDNGQILGGVGIILSVIGTIIGVINRRRCRSKCCGREASMSVVIDAVPPTPDEPKPPTAISVTS